MKRYLGYWLKSLSHLKKGSFSPNLDSLRLCFICNALNLTFSPRLYLWEHWVAWKEYPRPFIFPSNSIQKPKSLFFDVLRSPFILVETLVMGQMVSPTLFSNLLSKSSNSLIIMSCFPCYSRGQCGQIFCYCLNISFPSVFKTFFFSLSIKPFDSQLKSYLAFIHCLFPRSMPHVPSVLPLLLPYSVAAYQTTPKHGDLSHQPFYYFSQMSGSGI